MISENVHQKHVLFLSLFLSFFFLNEVNAQKDTILLFHPTVANLNTIEYLIESDILTLDTSKIHFLGVAHVSEGYNYKNTRSYILSESNMPFSIRIYSGELYENDVFRKNSLTNSFKKLIDNCRGAIFFGGPDMPPRLYSNKTNLHTTVYDPGRHFFEISGIFHFLGSETHPNTTPLLDLKPDFCILGICLGMQSLNVGTGGTLYQDIPTEVYNYHYREDVILNSKNAHRNYYFDDPTDSTYLTSYHFHKISFLNEKSDDLSKLCDIKSPFVLSSHHQAIKDLPTCWNTLATSADGKIIEIIRHKKYKNVLGVQFHPEKTALYDSKQFHSVNQDSIINFNKYIIEKKSFNFHSSFWNYLSTLMAE